MSIAIEHVHQHDLTLCLYELLYCKRPNKVSLCYNYVCKAVSCGIVKDHTK